MDVRFPTPSLVVLIGASGSGKTTWAEKVFHPAEVVSSDRLRAIVGAGEEDQAASAAAFSLLDQIVTERLRRGLTTVVDTLGMDGERRRSWLAQARTAGIPAQAVVFPVSAALAIDRNRRRPHPVPRRVVESQVRRMREVEREVDGEGFDAVHRVDPAGDAHRAEPDAVPVIETESKGHGFGLLLGRFGWLEGDADWAGDLAAVATRAERAGFRDLWLMDHLRQIPRAGRPWDPIPEPHVVLSLLAATTKRIRLGTLVTPVTRHHPAVLGKMVATLDVVSSGRVNLGLGVGSNRAEHEEYGIEFPPLPERYRRLEETVELLRLMWGKGAPSFHGETVRADRLACYPRPVQERIPITIGGSGQTRTLRLVASHGDACNLFGDPDQVRRGLEALRSHCARLGRDQATVEAGHLIDVTVAPDRRSLRDRIDALRPRNTTPEEFASRHGAGTVADQVERIRRYRQAGATYTVVSMPDPHLDGSLESFAAVIAAAGGP